MIADRVAVIGCGRRKVWDVRGDAPLHVMARSAYVGPLFSATRKHVEARYERWLILSAKYGLIAPTELITSYDVKLTRPTAEFVTLVHRQADELNIFGVEVVVFAGKAYVDLLRAVSDASSIVAPLAGLPMFQRMRWLREQG